MHFGGAPSLDQPLSTLVVLRSSVNSKPFHVNYNNSNLKAGARWCNYSSICSYCRGSCLPGRNITVTVCFRFVANLSWLDAFNAPFQGLGILAFEFSVKQSITKGGSRIHFWQPRDLLLRSRLVSLLLGSHLPKKTWLRALGPFLESPGNVLGPKSNFQIEIQRIRARVLANKLQQFCFLNW